MLGFDIANRPGDVSGSHPIYTCRYRKSVARTSNTLKSCVFPSALWCDSRRGTIYEIASSRIPRLAGFALLVLSAAARSQAPGAPADLTVVSAATTRIVLNWTAPADDGNGAIEAYNVYRCDEPCTLDANDHWIAWVTGGTTFTDTHDDSDPAEAGGTSPLAPETAYRYAVAAYRGGEGDWSNQVTATTAEIIASAPGAPREFTARGSESTVTLSWRAPGLEGGGALGAYTLYRAVGDSCGELGEYMTGIPASTAYLEDTDVSAGQDYCYRLVASNSAGESAPTDVQTVRTVTVGPPLDLEVTAGGSGAAAGGGGNRIGLGWTAPSEDGGGPVDGYDVYRCEQTGAQLCTPTYLAWVVDGAQYLDRGLTAGTTYRYAVDAVRANAAGGKSNEVTFRAGVAAVAQPGWVEGLPVRVADGGGATGGNTGGTATEIVLLVADSGVPAGLLLELPTLDAPPGFWAVIVTSENARHSLPAAPAGLVHAAGRVLRLAALDKLPGGQADELPTAATVCLPRSRIADGVDPGTPALYETTADGQSWTPLEAVHRPGLVCGATRRFTRVAVFGRLAEAGQATDAPPGPEDPSGSAPHFPRDAAIGDLVFVVGAAIEPVTLPSALGGDIDAQLNGGELSDYSFDPPDLPRGLTFNRFTRVIEGTPARHTPRTNYTLWAHDDDTDYSVEDAASLRFTIEVTGDIRRGATPAPRFGEGAAIGDLVFTAGVEIDPVTFPRAAGGDIDVTLNGGELSDYSFDPPDLPAGLAFDRNSRMLSGIPARSLETTDYTYWVHDDDGDYSAEDADSLAFTLTVNSGGSTVGGTFVEPYQYMERSDWNLDRNPDGMTANAVAWLGDRVHAPLMVWTDGDGAPESFRIEMSDLVADSGRVIPATQVSVLFPRYVAADPEIRGCNGYGSREGVEPAWLADALATTPGSVELPDDPYKIWMAVDVPRNACPADYRGTLTVKSSPEAVDGARFSLDLKVLPLDLRAPADWRFALDIWQHPERVLALHNEAHPDAPIVRWSDGHYRLLEDAYRLLADTGQKAVTATLKDGAFGAPGMVRWVRVSESRDEWRFDFSVFGAHVETLASWGIDQRIDAYGILGWNRDEIPYWSEELQAARILQAPIGSAAHSTVWSEFLTQFRTYLKGKGWFEKTYLAVDEATAQMPQIVNLIRSHDTGWKIALSHFNASLPDNVGQHVDVMNVFAGVAGTAISSRTQDQLWSLYTSCHSEELMPVTRVNSLLTRDSNPADIEWLTWYADKLGMDGYSRWAYDYWQSADSLDPRQGTTHTTGDFSLIYRTSNDSDLEPVTSVRLEMLRQGVQAFEKRRLLRDLLTDRNHASGLQMLDALLGDGYISAAGAADGLAKDDLARAREQLDTLSIEASTLVEPDSRCAE